MVMPGCHDAVGEVTSMLMETQSIKTIPSPSCQSEALHVFWVQKNLKSWRVPGFNQHIQQALVSATFPTFSVLFFLFLLIFVYVTVKTRQRFSFIVVRNWRFGENCVYTSTFIFMSLSKPLYTHFLQSQCHTPPFIYTMLQTQLHYFILAILINWYLIVDTVGDIKVMANI